ncbi:MAG: type II secretion system protein [Lacipirellulaceae bacterium]
MLRRGQTFVETLTAVLVIGILAGVLAPKLLGGSEEAKINATIVHLKTIAAAAERCRAETGSWPADGSTAELPAALAPYLRPNLFAAPCPLGGAYDWDGNSGGFVASVTVTSTEPDSMTWEELDGRIDDGHASNGWVRTDGAGDERLRLILQL